MHLQRIWPEISIAQPTCEEIKSKRGVGLGHLWNCATGIIRMWSDPQGEAAFGGNSPPPVSPTLKKFLFQWHWQSGASRKLLGIKSNWWCSGSGSAKQCRALEIKGTSSTGTSSWYKQWRASKPPQLVPTLNFDFISTHNGICPPLPCVTC